MTAQLGLLSAKFTGQYEVLRDGQTGLLAHYIQTGVAAGRYTTVVPGVCSYAQLQARTDLALCVGLRMRVHNVGPFGSMWMATGTGFIPDGPIVCTGTPEAAITAPVGSLALRTDGGASTTLYVKQSGTGNTGWVAK